MTTGRVFAFVKTQNMESLKTAIKDINRQPRPPFAYRRLVMTAPRRGWLALLFEADSIDFYLLRNVSKTLATETFGLSQFGVQISYRYYANGATHGAYESHLELKLAERLRRLLVTQNIKELDRHEPAESLVQYRFRQHQMTNSWELPSVQETIPPFVTKFYQGNIEHIKNLLKPDVNIHYIAEVLTPGYSPETIMERLLNALNLPYLSQADEIIYPYADDPSLKRSLAGAMMLDPRRWHDAQPLPNGWETITFQH